MNLFYGIFGVFFLFLGTVSGVTPYIEASPVVQAVVTIGGFILLGIGDILSTLEDLKKTTTGETE